MSSQLDTNLFPFAYLITFSTYGTWLHGDQRGSVDRMHNVYGTERLAASPCRKGPETLRLKHAPVLLNRRQRKSVELVIREVCSHRRYVLYAVNVRSNHVHAVIGASCMPEQILDSLKAYATRRLRQEGLVPVSTKLWTRHGSTRYLGKEDQVAKAVAYVMYDQGED